MSTEQSERMQVAADLEQHWPNDVECCAAAKMLRADEAEIAELRTEQRRQFNAATLACKQLRTRAERAESELAALRANEAGAFSLVADIRAAARDPTGKLMQPELIARIAADRALRERVAKAPVGKPDTISESSANPLAYVVKVYAACSRDEAMKIAVKRVRLLIDDEQE